jgi:hypothetical protein
MRHMLQARSWPARIDELGYLDRLRSKGYLIEAPK